MEASRSQQNQQSILVTFPGGKRVDADLGTHVVRTDQSVAHGGTGADPEPFELFLASLATCAGFYVLAFCRTREIPSHGIVLTQRHVYQEGTHRLSRVEIEITLPPTFPEKYRALVVQAAAECKVKKLLLSPPEVIIRLHEAQSSRPVPTGFANGGTAVRS